MVEVVLAPQQYSQRQRLVAGPVRRYMHNVVVKVGAGQPAVLKEHANIQTTGIRSVFK